MAQSKTGIKLCEAAIKMIVMHGYKGATTRLIAAEAGVTEVTLFRKFGTKEELIKAAIQHNSEEFPENAIAYTGNMEFDLVKIVTTHISLVKHQGHFKLMMLAELSRNPNLREALEIPSQKMCAVIQILERYQSEGQLQGNNPTILFLSLLGPIMMNHGMNHLIPNAVTNWDVDIFIKNFLHGNGTQQAPETHESSDE